MAVIIAIIFLGQKSLRSAGFLKSLKHKLPILFLSAGIVLVYNLVDHRSEKIVFDELILQASAIQLLHSNEYMVPEYSHNLQDKFAVFSQKPDKRPPLFPVLLSLTHRVLGYSQNNGYLLNSILGIGLFFVLGNIGKTLNPRHGDVLMILAFASIPLVSQNITGQHFEILYLFLIACLLWISIRIASQDKVQEIPLAYLLAAAISLTRYEGLMFLMVPFFLHLLLTLRTRKVKDIILVVLLCPLVSLFVFALLGYIQDQATQWLLEESGSKQAFGMQYWVQNLSACMDFMLSANREQPGSLALALLGVAAAPVAGLEVTRLVYAALNKEKSISPFAIVIILFAICGLLYLGLVFSYHWGWVNSPETARFILFPYLFLAILIIFAMRNNPFLIMLIGVVLAIFCLIWNGLSDNGIELLSYGFTLLSFMAGMVLVKWLPERFPAFFLGFWIVFLMIETLPAIQQARYERNCIPMKSVQIFHEWIEKHKDSNNVFISKTHSLGIIHQESSTSLQRFRENPDTLRHLKAQHLVNDIFVLQLVIMQGGEYGIPDPYYSLPKGIVLELVEFKRITDEYGARMVRILDWSTEEGS